jgi:hypothetical protein
MAYVFFGNFLYGKWDAVYNCRRLANFLTIPLEQIMLQRSNLLNHGPANQSQSTYIYRVQQYLSPRRNWDSPTPSLASECAPLPGTKGHTRLRMRGCGSPNSDDWRKS